MTELIEHLSQLEIEARTGVDFYATASQLEYLDTLEIAEAHDHILIKAEYGCGKTWSLKPIAHKTLYVAHRCVLIQQNSHFAKSVTINALPSVNVNDYEYIVIDEVVGTLHGLSWSQVDYNSVTEKLRTFEGKIIALDRDGSEEFARLLSKHTNKNFSFYHHRTGSRNKSVLVTECIEDVIDLASKSPPGIRLILCDTKWKAEELNRLILNQPTFVITAATGNAMDIIREAENCGDCWIFASPKIREGLSLEGHRYVFNAYVQNGTQGMLTPVWRGCQALHRVRNLSAARVVCLLGHCREDMIDKNKLKSQLLAQYVKAKDTIEEMTEYLLSVGTIDSYIDDVLGVGFEIYSYLKHLTSIQNNDNLNHWLSELKESGYNPIHVDSLDTQLGFKYEELKQQSSDVFDVMFDKSHHWFLLRHGKEAFEDEYGIEDNELNRTRLATLKYYGHELANDIEFVIGYWSDKRFDKVKARMFLVANQVPFNHGSLFATIDTAKFRAVRTILKDVIGDDWKYLGVPQLKNHFVVAKSDVYSHPSFAVLKQQMGKQDEAGNRWFWNLLRKDFRFDFEQCGKNKAKYRIFNDIHCLTYPEITQILRSTPQQPTM